MPRRQRRLRPAPPLARRPNAMMRGMLGTPFSGKAVPKPSVKPFCYLKSGGRFHHKPFWQPIAFVNNGLVVEAPAGLRRKVLGRGVGDHPFPKGWPHIARPVRRGAQAGHSHGPTRTCTDPKNHPHQSGAVRVSPCPSVSVRGFPPRPPRALPAPPHVPPRGRPGHVPRGGARASRAGGVRGPRRGPAPGCGRAWRPKTPGCSSAADNSADTRARNSRRFDMPNTKIF